MIFLIIYLILSILSYLFLIWADKKYYNSEVIGPMTLLQTLMTFTIAFPVLFFVSLSVLIHGPDEK